MNTLHVKTGDTVVVLSGKDKGKQGETGGIVERETPIRACKVMRVCPKCDKGTRVAYKVTDGKKVRVCKKCGAEI